MDRKAAVGGFVQVGTPGSTSFSDTGRPAGTAFLYQVRAVNSGGTSGNSVADLATTVIFTDPSLAGVAVKAVHIAELRTAVDAVRLLAGQGLFGFTGAGAGTAISAAHLTDLRTALDGGRGPLGLSTGGFTDPSPAGVTIKAVHFQELRNRVE